MINKLKYSFFLLFLILFLIAYFFKIFFLWDYSAKFDITDINCNQIFRDAPFIYDNDLKTTWGLSELHEKNEDFIISFSKRKNLNAIEIINMEYKNIPFPDIIIKMSDNGEDYNECKYELRQNNEKMKFFFSEACGGYFLNMVYNNKETGYYPITEINLYEKI